MIVLGLIPARAGSRGIPGKNERPLAGRSLVARAVDAARASGVIDRIVLSTDSDTIGAIGAANGVEVIRRPAELAADDTPMLPVLVHTLNVLEAEGWRCDALALLQPTQPFRTGAHIADAVRLLEQTGATAVASVVPIPAHYAPQYAMRIGDGRLLPYLPEGGEITRRQDVEPAYSRDGTVYLTRVGVIRQGSLYGDDCRPLVLAPDESVNLDTPDDWERAAALLEP